MKSTKREELERERRGERGKKVPRIPPQLCGLGKSIDVVRQTLIYAYGLFTAIQTEL